MIDDLMPVLRRALNNYTQYQETRSIHLIEQRARWIPIVLKEIEDQLAVCKVVDGMIAGRDSWLEPLYQSLREDQKIAVAMTVMQHYSEYCDSLATALREKTKPEFLVLSLAKDATDRVFRFLRLAGVDHAILAIRNCGPREGGPFSMQIISELRLVRIPVFMSVFIMVRSHWDTVGLKAA
jgi:hypothetical protein